MIDAKIIADSIAPHGGRLTTFLLRFPRIVLAEFNTHRMISKNSASSRAIPFARMIQMVEKDPFIPIKWMKEHKGMQGTEYFSHAESIPLGDKWLVARDQAVTQAKILSELGITKQICNRLLEPFMWHTVIATGTDWQNFFALRAHDAAEIHIQELAYQMLTEYNESTPEKIEFGSWHIPFGKQFDCKRLLAMGPNNSSQLEMLKVKVASARCARISYLNFEGKDDYEADIKLHDQLSQSGHMSPFEHCARAEFVDNYSGNFKGFTQYRKMFARENRCDLRVLR